MMSVMTKQVLDFSEMHRQLVDLQEDAGLDAVNSNAYVRIMAKVREIFATPGLLDLIHIYQITLRVEDQE